MNIKNTAFAALGFVVIYNLLFFKTGFGIGTTLFILLLNIYFFLAKNDDKHLNLALFSSVASVLFAFLFAFRGNGIVQLVDLALSFFFALTSLYLYRYSGSLLFKVSRFLLIPFAVTERSLISLLSSSKQSDQTSESSKNSYSSLIRGLLITIPIFIILLILLAQADPIFGKFTGDFFKNIGERTIVSAILFIALLSLGLIKFFPKTHETINQTIPEGKSSELLVITTSIIGLFAIFIIIQFRYLFLGVGERELHELGINSLTYSEYVRKGFFELLIAAAIVCGVILYIFKYLHNLENSQKQIIQIFSSILTIETGLLLLSAVKRLGLYADAHGLTRARVFGFIFLIWLGLLLAIFFIRIFKELREKEFFASCVFVTLTALVLVNIINIDGLIALRYRPTVNGEVDYYYLTSLSTDATAAWAPSIEYVQETVNRLEGLNEITPEDNRKLIWASMTMEQLKSKIAAVLEKNTWQTFNFSEYQAYRFVTEKRWEFDKISSLSERIAKLQSKVSAEVQRSTQLDRSTNPPLLR